MFMNRFRSVRGPLTRRSRSRSKLHALLESLERREVPATLAPIPNQSAPQFLGIPIVLSGGANPQTYTAASSNPLIQPKVIQGQFLEIDVSHASSGASDPAFSGTFVIQVFDQLTPTTVQRILNLVQQGFYTSPTQPNSVTPPGPTATPNKNFHRVVPGFVVQGGSVSGDGRGTVAQPGYPFKDEFNQALVFTGNYQVAMANAGDDDNSSQFFITDGTDPNRQSLRNLDFNHTIFGQVVQGQSVVEQMLGVARTGETPIQPILITATRITTTNPNATLLIDVTAAPSGETGTITVTATDPGDLSTATQSFQINVTPNTLPNPTPPPTEITLNERPFLGLVPNQVIGRNATTNTTQPWIYQLQYTNAEPNDTISFIVRGGITRNATTGERTFTPLQNATATVDSSGVVRLTPTAGFTGTINVVVGVRDQVNRASDPNSPDNFDTETFTITVRNGDFVNLPPIATPLTVSVPFNTPTTAQLGGITANPNSTTQNLVYEILTSPTAGTISAFNPTTGQFTYTPAQGYLGNATFTYRVRDTGDPQPNLTSNPATVTLQVVGAPTNAVRQIGAVLVVSPPAGPTYVPNNIYVTQAADGTIDVFVNGFLSNFSPLATSLDRIVVYGTKSNDVIKIDPSVTLPATLNGGRGGTNRVTAGGGNSRLHGWFGQNRLEGGPRRDQLIGRTGHVRFIESPGPDLYFAGNGRPGKSRGHLVPPASSRVVKTLPPTGSFYRFKNGKLVPIPTPRPRFIQPQHFQPQEPEPAS
jgi:cyclophilin family peptidyl-prolyl cis-trans isomerase